MRPEGLLVGGEVKQKDLSGITWPASGAGGSGVSFATLADDRPIIRKRRRRRFGRKIGKLIREVRRSPLAYWNLEEK
jgi:hypothetical protein